jgi:hypothetical protein
MVDIFCGKSDLLWRPLPADHPVQFQAPSRNGHKKYCKNAMDDLMLEMKFSAAEQLKLELGPPNHFSKISGSFRSE